MRLLFCLLFFIIFCFSITVYGAEELRVISPASLKAKFPNDGLLHEVPALFGVPSYRQARSGTVIIANPEDGCDAINKSNWPPEKDPEHPTSSVILLIKRGTCSFVTKVRNAQNAGAISVIVYNDQPGFLPFMADDGTGKNVVIPSVLISNEDALTLINFINNPTLSLSSSVTGTDTTTPNPNNKHSYVLMSLLYLLPRPDNRVEWDLFTSSWDPQTVEFKEEMIPVIQALDTQQLFTPHYLLIYGAAIGCSADSLPCGKQCTHHGKYCAMDPEKNTDKGIDGRDVILQDLREYCVNKYINDTYKQEGKNQYLWFQFVSTFRKDCYDINKPELWRDSSLCADKILTKLKIDPQLIDQCITESGGADSNDPNAINTVLQQFLYDKTTYGVISLPYSFVNLAPYHGSYTCPNPIRNDGTCGVVEAICQGYATQPEACTSDKSCEFGKQLDRCGVCGGDDKSCVGCDGLVNSGKIYDACGVCGGDGKCQQLSTGQIVGIVFASLFSIGLLSIGVYIYMKRQNKKMREDIDSLLKQYLPLEGGVNQGTGNHQPGGRLVDVNDSDM